MVELILVVGELVVVVVVMDKLILKVAKLLIMKMIKRMFIMWRII